MNPGDGAAPVLAYNTNGFYHHRLEDAVRLLAEAGYGGVALTPDVHHLNPLATGPSEWAAFRRLLESLGLEVVVETGARFILDPRRKHHPSLLTPGAERRLAFLERCADLARALGAPVLSFHSGGAPPALSRHEAMERLAARTAGLVRYAAARGVTVALEPEPGMFIASMEDFHEFHRRPDVPEELRLTLDVGHAFITEKLPVAEVIRRSAPLLVNVHLDDVRGGRHEHLPLGEGEIPFAEVMAALRALPDPPFTSVELSRHGHEAPARASAALAFLRGLPRGRRGPDGAV